MTSQDREWWRRPFSTFQTNIQDIDAAMDVAAELETIRRFGADTWLLNTGGISSFYPSELDFQTPSPFLSRRASGDLTGDAVEAAHEADIRVIARIDLSKVSESIAADHPDWLFVSAAGESQAYESLISTCPNRPYWQTHSFDIVGEILDRYPVDGFFFNWFSFNAHDYGGRDHGVCHCDDCREKFRVFSGGEDLPENPDSPAYPRWQQFTAACIVDLGGRLAEEIESRAPGTPLILQRGTPLPYGEVGNGLGREFWPYASGDIVSVRKGVEPETPVFMLLVSFLDIAYRLTGDQPERFLQYMLQAIARGANPCTYIIGVPSRVPYAHLESAGAVNRHFRTHEDVYDGLRPSASIALIRPRASMRTAGYEGQSDTSLAVDEYRGIHRALQERHRPFEAIDISSLDRFTADRLARFELIVLPAVGELGPAVSATLDDYVRAGGHLLITGDSAVTADRIELETHPARSHAGQALRGHELRSRYALPNPPSGDVEFTFSPPVLPILGELRSFSWHDDAETFGALTTSAPWGPPEKSYGHLVTEDPIGASRTTEHGSVAALTTTLGAAYTAAGTTEIRDALIGIVDAVVEPVVETNLPPQVELVIGRSGDRLVLHLLNQTGIRFNTVLPHVAVNDVSIRLRSDRAYTISTLLVAGVDHQVEADSEGFVTIRIARLGLFEVAVLTP